MLTHTIKHPHTVTSNSNTLKWSQTDSRMHTHTIKHTYTNIHICIFAHYYSVSELYTQTHTHTFVNILSHPQKKLGMTVLHVTPTLGERVRWGPQSSVSS